MKAISKNRKKLIVCLVILILAIPVWIFFQHNFHPGVQLFSKTTSSVDTSKNDSSRQNLGDFYLSIPSLGIETPITANVNGADKTAYDKSLEDGVAQMRGSSLPGGGSNIFIFGHSSFYQNQPGKYKEIFATLNKLQENDQIIIWYKKKEFDYSVTKTEIVDPTNVAIADPSKNEQLTLMTCWPPNTTDKRYVVIAKPQN